MEQIWEKVLDTAAANIKKVEEYLDYNARHAKNTFEISDKVWHVNIAIKGRKAKGLPWVGLYTVIGRTETGNYLLKDKHGHEWKKAVAPNQLKKSTAEKTAMYLLSTVIVMVKWLYQCQYTQKHNLYRQKL